MKKIQFSFVILLSFTLSNFAYSQCVVTAFPDTAYICIGEPVLLSATSYCSRIIKFADDFNSGQLGSNWFSNASPMFTNICPPGVDTSTYLWIGPASYFPRELVTQAIDVSDSSCQVSFHMKYAEQGIPSPCEGPDMVTEGVYLQYSLSGSNGPWTDINYWNPNGGHDTSLTNWNYYTEAVPFIASTSSTNFRWYQNVTSGNSYDHWGLDNISISCGLTSSVSWSHGPTVLSPPNPVYPTHDSMYIISVVSNIPGSIAVFDTVFVFVDPIPNIYNVTGGGSYITGSSGVSVGLSGSDIGVDYTLNVNGYYTNIVRAGTGGQLDFGLQTMIGTYTITAKSHDAQCFEYMSDSAIVSIYNSIEEDQTANVNIYPNPTNGIFTVEGENIELVTITDISGKVILEMEVKEDIIEIDLSTYPKAMYFVNVYTEDGVGVKKILIE